MRQIISGLAVLVLFGCATCSNAQPVITKSAIPKSWVDTDGNLTADSDTKIATQKATKTYVDALEPSTIVGAVVANGNSGAAKTINWTTGTVQTLTISEITTLTFTAPAGPCHLTLILTNPGAFAITWPTMLWAGGAVPGWTVAGKDIVTFLYTSGTTYYGQAGLDFK
jgi:hypothetical protein